MPGSQRRTVVRESSSSAPVGCSTVAYRGPQTPRRKTSEVLGDFGRRFYRCAVCLRCLHGKPDAPIHSCTVITVICPLHAKPCLGQGISPCEMRANKMLNVNTRLGAILEIHAAFVITIILDLIIRCRRISHSLVACVIIMFPGT